MDIDVDKLTLAEVEEIEDLTGRPIDNLFPEGAPKARVMRALYFVTARRNDPGLTFESTGDISVSEISEALNPTDAATPS